MNANIDEKLAKLPQAPGVYLMKDSGGAVIYVGKALNLRNRVKSYFKDNLGQGAHSEKTRALVKSIFDIEWILTDSEIEALILECNLIKKYKPKYNVMLIDDKGFPYVRIGDEDFPKVEYVQRMERDGAKYFGPYTSRGDIKDTLKLLKQIFPLRSCASAAAWGRQRRPCLNRQIGRCLAPCTGQIDREVYREMIRQVVLFLEGRQETLCRQIDEKMNQAAEELRFEEAARLRDQANAIRRVMEKQKIVSARDEDYDVINYARGKSKVCFQVFFVREGKLLGRESFFMEGVTGDEDVLTPFLQQYYSRAPHIPPEIVIPERKKSTAEPADDISPIEVWLTQLRGRKGRIKTPKRSERKGLLDMVEKNARDHLLQTEQRVDGGGDRIELGLEEIREVLGLAGKPRRMECYDVSHLSGTETVASMAVSIDGRPRPEHYRRFRIKSVEGNDDYASLAELILRRFSRERLQDKAFGELPDLVVIDGGKGQLSSVRSVMELLDLGDIPAVGLAKQHEWLYLPSLSDPLVLDQKSPAMQILQSIRDEAHRFALTYHRLLRGKRSLNSALDEIPGLGPKGKQALLASFDLSLKRIMAAGRDELAQTPGLSKKAAEAVYKWFHPDPIA